MNSVVSLPSYSLTSGVHPAPSMLPMGTPTAVIPDSASTLTIIAANLSELFAGMGIIVFGLCYVP